jgi:hypothetical protein
VFSRQDFLHEVLAHVSFPIKIHYAIPIGYNPVNQTPLKRKNSQELNPTKFL